jgi:hypothetical protein
MTLIKSSPSADSSITNAEVVKVPIADAIQALISILRILCQCIDKHSALLKQLYE